MRSLARRAATLAFAAVGVAAAHGCTEELGGGNACPIVCPGQTVELEETEITGVVLDSTIPGYPSLGEEPFLLLTSRGDTLETRVIIRFDTLPTTYTPTGSTTAAPIEAVTNAKLPLRLRFDTTGGRDRRDQTVTVEAYDVDTTTADGADSSAASMLPLFRSDRFLGTLTFKPADLLPAPGGTATDTAAAQIPINDDYLLAKILSKGRLRVGLLVRGEGGASAELTIQGLGALRSPTITFDVPGATPVPRTAPPYSASPSDRFIAAPLADFVIVARQRAPETPSDVIAIGGLPGRRTYLRFDLPSRIVDSTSVVRATLLLTQYPNKLAFRAADSVTVYPSPVSATERVTDIAKQAALLFRLQPEFRLDSLRLVPEDSGAVEIELVGSIQVWRLAQAGLPNRALVLRIPPIAEGVEQDELFFFSSTAAEGLRPRLRIVYAPPIGFGLP